MHVIGVHVCVYMEARGQCLVSSSIAVFCEAKETLKLADTARLVGQGAPWTCLSPPSSGITVMHHHAQLLMWVLQTEAWVLMLTLQSQSLTEPSPTPILGRS